MMLMLTAVSVALVVGCGGTENGKVRGPMDVALKTVDDIGDVKKSIKTGRVNSDAPTDVILRYVEKGGNKKEVIRAKRVICGPQNRSELCKKVKALTRKSLRYDVSVGDCFPVPGSASSEKRDREPCRSVTVRRSPLDPVPPTVPCSLVGGFSIDASVTGRIDGEPVRAKYDDAYNCDSQRWTEVEEVFLEAGVLKVPVFENPPFSNPYPIPEIPGRGAVDPIPVN